MTTSPFPSPEPELNDAAPSRTLWGFLGAPIAENATFIGGVLYWLAIAFRWFLRLLLLLLVAGVILGIGALIFGSLPLRSSRRGGKSVDDNALSDVNLVELEFLDADYDPEDDRSDSDDEK